MSDQLLRALLRGPKSGRLVGILLTPQDLADQKPDLVAPKETPFLEWLRDKGRVDL